MREWTGKKAQILVDVDGKILFYTADIQEVTDTHISFLDKFGKNFTFRLTDVVQINEQKEAL